MKRFVRKITRPLLLALLCTFILPTRPDARLESASAQRPTARPNIIVIMSDDMGYSDLGCYGGEMNTPNLDALAKNGLRFTQFYNTARCCPTRASLLTGLYPHQAGIGHMMGRNPSDARGTGGPLHRSARGTGHTDALSPGGTGRAAGPAPRRRHLVAR